ncbi:sigma-70 family RNA polymerase sigma factor [Paenibacillus glucanolyticus]|uniref:sigma-70 family RNA polymerase sigma factor n=1 Tax=Paenibacillus glucanolyticus TaxID=59843 RepID=UPI00096EABFC|nr:sigma-70 family RNA polymerase sigma factor [Paenibacillus glucanolyticus]OMF71457.1 RNA polymerase subunit sigma-24 [Paenibacillus glucanolyticus]
MLLDQIYAQYKPMMFGLAYRMLGNTADAEDIVQDVFSHFMGLDRGVIVNEKAYLAKMTTNRCINLLKSSKRQRETYTGPWLPEPMPDYDMLTRADPAERRENIGYAYLVLLQRLTPLERAIYIAKETLGLEYEVIAEMLGKTEVSCRKTFSRARQKMGPAREDPAGAGPRTEMQERFVEAFLRASDMGQFKPLLSLLKEEVTLLSDGGGKTRAALNPILGVKRVCAFFEGLYAKGSFREGFEPVSVNGEPGLLLRRDGRVSMVLTVDWEPDLSRIRQIFLVVNPDKLRLFNQNSPGTGP